MNTLDFASFTRSPRGSLPIVGSVARVPLVILALALATTACGSTVSVGEKVAPSEPEPAPAPGQELPGIVGPGTTAPPPTAPIDRVVQVAATTVATCARHVSGVVSCWGYGFGPTPVPVPALAGATHIAGGNLIYQCAVMPDGTVRCLDAANVGATGGANAPWFTIEDELGPITDALAVTVGELSACVRRSTGKVSCRSNWQSLATPTLWPTVKAFEGALDVHAGVGRICAVRADDVTCLGEWRYAAGACAGQSVCTCDDDDPSCTPEFGPFRVLSRAALGDPSAGAFVSVRTSWDYTAVVDAKGDVYGWGFDAHGEAKRPVDDARLQRVGAAAFDVNGGTACEILRSPQPTQDRILSCWGENRYGQTGKPLVVDLAMMPPPSAPYPVVAETSPSLVGMEGVSVGGAHACAWSSGTVYCWGLNEFGQIGDGTVGNVRYKAKAVTFAPPAVGILP